MTVSKAKGTAFETLIVGGFREAGFTFVERRATRGKNDGGDIAGIPGVVIECKNTSRVELSTWMAELAVEKDNARADVGAVVFKRRKHGQAIDQFVLMDLWTFLRLLKEAGR